MTAPSADDLIAELGLAPHPEGGFYRETWRHEPEGGGRGAGTSIYFLLRGEDDNRWHKVDAAEIWHFYGGAPLELWIADDDASAPVRHVLGPDVARGERPQVIVPAGAWQRARSTGAYTLTGCTVSPAFVFDHFTLAPKDWAPGS